MNRIGILTHRYNNARTSAAANEEKLTTANVNVRGFGKLFSRVLDGAVHAQPLFVPGLRMRGRRRRNIVFVATSNNSLYAYDADDPLAAEPYWRASREDFGPPAPSHLMNAHAGFELDDAVGITSTPVIDLRSKTIYVETVSFIENEVVHQLHALDIETGTNRQDMNSPIRIEPTVMGSPNDSDSGAVPFLPQSQLNAGGLLLLDGVIYLGYGSYHTPSETRGWILGYDAANLRPVLTYCTGPDAPGSDVLQSGCGLSSDGYQIYTITGSSSYGGGQGTACIAVKPGGDLPLAGSVHLDAPDRSELSAGPVIIHSQSADNLFACVTKSGTCCLIDMGSGHADGQGRVIDSIQACTTIASLHRNSRAGRLDAAPAYWNGLLYSWGEADYLRCFSVAGGKLSSECASSIPVPPGGGTPALCVSAQGDNRETGIVWAFSRYIDTGHGECSRGIIRAFRAAGLTELWNSEQRGLRDRIGVISSECPPAVADGKLFVPSRTELTSGDAVNTLSVYGLLPRSGHEVTDFWQQADVGTPIVGSMWESRGTVTITAGGDDIERMGDSCHLVYRRLSGDGRIVARVVDLFGRSLHPWAKAGVMMRQTLQPHSQQATMFVTPLSGTAFQNRRDRPRGFWHESGPKAKVPVWVRLVRDGTAVTGAVSLNGSDWQPVGTVRIPFSAEIYVGLVVSAHQGMSLPQHLVSAIFDNITLGV
jgi:hypothetical protein